MSKKKIKTNVIAAKQLKDWAHGLQTEVVKSASTIADMKPGEHRYILPWAGSLDSSVAVEPMGTVCVRICRTRNGFKCSPGDRDTPTSCGCKATLNGALKRADGGFDGLVCTACGAVWVRRGEQWRRDAEGAKWRADAYRLLGDTLILSTEGGGTTNVATFDARAV